MGFLLLTPPQIQLLHITSGDRLSIKNAGSGGDSLLGSETARIWYFKVRNHIGTISHLRIKYGSI
jgi:hypothetical protein